MSAANALPDLMGTIKIRDHGLTGWPSGFTMCGKPARKELRSVCSLTGVSIHRLPSIAVGRMDWRGTAVWDKGNSRPQKGRFRQQAEYIVWGSNGPMPINRPVSLSAGCFPIWKSAEPDSCDRETVAAYERCHPDL